MAGISSKAADALENKKAKYNGYELNTNFDLNLYESFYRTHNPQIGRFLQIDPQTSAFESLYAAMGNNPIRNFDILGDKLKNDQDKVIAKKATDDINKKIETLNKKSAEYAKQLEEKGLTIAQHDDLVGKKYEADESIRLLKGSIEEIQTLIDDKKNTFTFKQVDDNAKGSLYFEKDGTVQIEYLKGSENLIHEINHAAAVSKGIIKPKKERDRPTYDFNLKKGVTRLDFETDGYKKQYAYDPISLPRSDLPNPTSILEVTRKYVEGIVDDRGNHIYKKD